MLALVKGMSENSANQMSLSTDIDITEKMRASLVYILKNGGSMEIMRLAKLAYLSDYLFAKTFGDENGFLGGHKRFTYGPVPRSFYPSLRTLYIDHIASRHVNTIQLDDSSISTTVLSEKEKACIDKVLEEFKGTTLTQVKLAAYNTEPMLSIQQKEKSLNGLKMINANMDFELIKKHPLLDNDDLDISFMESPEFQKNLI